MNAKPVLHDFVFRRLIACAHCRYHLIGERQKGRVYYRCHTRECPITSVREDRADSAIKTTLAPVRFLEEEIDELKRMAASLSDDWADKKAELIRAVHLQLDSLESRESRLADAYIDGGIDRGLFEKKKLALLMERSSLDEQRNRIETGAQVVAEDIMQFIERVKALPLSYELANPDEKRDLLKSITSNFFAREKCVVIELRSPFREIAELTHVSTCGLDRDRPRTKMKKVFDIIIKHFTTQAEEHRRQEDGPLETA